MIQQALGQLFVRHGVIAPEALAPLLEQQAEKRQPLTELLIQTQAATEEGIAKALAAECGLEYVAKFDVAAIDPQISMRIPIGYSRSHRLLVTGEDEQGVYVLCADPLDTSGLDDVRASFGKPVTAQVAPASVIVDAINRVFERGATSQELKSEDSSGEDEEIDILDSDDDAPIIRWVNSLFSQAVRERASDIHIEPEEREVLVRFRVDGQLHISKRASRQFMSAVVARVKIMAGLNIAEKRLPQDGRISLKIAGRGIDIRVSTIPTSRDHERIVMRLLQKTNTLLGLDELGFAPRDLFLMHQLIERPNGIILVTGPTGSGKTTTLYACLNRINRPNVNILTAEDPVEYEIGGIHQVHVQPKIGLTFASAMRAFLRQDPDVIMVGEIRDLETAEIAIQASMTGHLVLSTIHTNDAAGAFTRLIDMDVANFKVRSTVIGLLAQRLVRILCNECKEPYEATPYELEQLGIDPAATERRLNRKVTSAYRAPGVDYQPPGWQGPGMPVFHRAVGCEQCNGSGYAGRRGIYELLMADDSVGQLVMAKADAQTIKRAAIANGMDSLRDDGARKVLLGRTTVEAVLAATQEDSYD